MPESESVHRANQRLDHATTVGGVCGALPRQHLQLLALLRALPALAGQLKRSMRRSYKAGEKCFIDYAGQTVPIVDPACIFRPNVLTLGWIVSKHIVFYTRDFALKGKLYLLQVTP